MALRTFILTEAQATELRQAYEQTKDGPTRTRYQAVRLYGQGYPVPQIEDITGCSRTSLMDWSRRYRRQGGAALVDQRRGGNRAKLTPQQRATVRSYLQPYTPRQLFGPDAATPAGRFWTLPDLKRAVEQWFGVTWSSSASYYALLADCGFSYQRTQKVFRSRSARRGDLRGGARKKLIDVAQTAPETVIVAEDEASLYLQATLRRVWAPRGQPPVVAAEPSRVKTNFYGTLNLRTGAEVVMQADKLNAETTAAYLEQVLVAYPKVPLLLLWDRAPWHRGAAVRTVLAANPRLEVVEFPVAAPELNPQEHVWKATREAVSHNHAQRQLGPLAERFEAHLTSTIFPTSFLDHRGFHTIATRLI